MGFWGRAAAAVMLAATAAADSIAAQGAEQVPFNTRLDVEGGDADIEGTNGYVTLGGLAGVGLDRDYEKGMVFLDLAGHYTFEGDPAFNAALGYRYADWDDGVVWGVNAGVSGRNLDDNWYLWCNVGLERLSPDYDLRANGYIRCGDGLNNERCETIGFEGNSLLVATRGDLGMQGFDLSIGSDAGALISEDLYGKAEFYAFFDQSDDSAIGGRAALDWKLMDNVAVNGWVSYDTLFGVSGLAGITLSFGGPAERSDKADANDTGTRLIAFIQHRELLPVHENARIAGSTRAVTDENGDPLPFWHVDNTADPGGDGTAERPWNVLADAGAEAGNTGPGDVIIFHEGDGTTTNQTDGITLQDGQYFLGGGLDRDITFAGCECNLADLLDEGRPVMTDDDGDALRLADGNTTGGYDIVDSAGVAVRGVGTHDLTMFDMSITDSRGTGIDIVDGTGAFLFSGLTLVGNDGSITSPGDDEGGGMNLLRMAGDITIEDTLCSDSGVAGTDGRTYDCVEIGTGPTGDLNVAVRNSQFNDTEGNGFETHLTGSGRFTLLMDAVQLSGNFASALSLTNDLGSTGLSQTTIHDATIVDNGWSGIEAAKLNGGSVMQLVVEDSLIADNSRNATEAGPIEESGIGMTVRDGVADLIVRNTVLSGHAAAGIYLESSPELAGGALLRALIEDSSITGNGFGRSDDFVGGVVVFAQSADLPPASTAQVELTMIGNSIDGNDTNGLLTVPASGIVAPPFAFPQATICTNLQENEGADRLFLNNGTSETFDFPLPIGPVTYTVGGSFFEDPASGGNANPIQRSGPIGSRACQTAQKF